MSDTGRTSTSERIKAANVARATETDMHRFLAVAGFYDTARFTPDTRDETDPQQRSAGVLLEAVRAFVADDTDDTEMYTVGREEDGDEDMRVVP